MKHLCWEWRMHRMALPADYTIANLSGHSNSGSAFIL
jgi:hypothetical protein